MNLHTHYSAIRSVLCEGSTSSRGRRISQSALIALVSLGSIAFSGCHRRKAEVNTVAPRVVRAFQVDSSQHSAEQVSQFTGIVRARTESNLGFRVGGKIAERLVDAGEAVKAGQPLLTLDPTDYQLALRAARAVQKQAALELERVRVLVEKRAESRDALERATAAAASSAAQAEELADQVSYTTLCADADGVVLSTLAEPGQVVAAGQPVLVFAKDGLREAAIDIPESSLERIRGGKATARLYLNSGLNVPATLREISGAADPVTRTYRARYVLEGNAAQFPLGATVTVRISTGADNAQPTIEIPLGALIDRGHGASVWVIDPKSSAVVKRSVTIVTLGAETASISRGVKPGDTLVALGAQLLNPGEVVRVDKLSTTDAR